MIVHMIFDAVLCLCRKYSKHALARSSLTDELREQDKNANQVKVTAKAMEVRYTYGVRKPNRGPSVAVAQLVKAPTTDAGRLGSIPNPVASYQRR